MIKHIVMFSTGLSSAYLANYVVNQHGKENTILFFTDTLWEDEDNYRFMNEVSQYLGLSITWIADGRTPEDVFFEKRFLGNFGTAPCSKELKMRQTVIFIEELRQKGFEPILYFGIGKKEKQRSIRIAYNYSHYCIEPVQCCFPLTEMDLDNHKLTKIIQQEWGIKRPRMYDYGFKHANCAGRCVKAGIKHYKLLYKVWNERFLQQEHMEKHFCETVNRYTILRKDGVPYSLEQLRYDIEKQGVQLDALNEIEQDPPCECVFEQQELYCIL